MVHTDARATELATLLGRLAELMSDDRSESPQPPPGPMPERVLLTVEEAAKRLGIGRTLTYKLRATSTDHLSTRDASPKNSPATTSNPAASETSPFPVTDPSVTPAPSVTP